MKASKLFVSLMTLAILGCTALAKGPEIGSKAPEFELIDTKGSKHSLSAYKGKLVVLEWVNHGCPFVVKHYDTGNMQALQKEATGKGVVWLSICSSALGKEGHLTNDEWNGITKDKKARPTAVLIDEEGTVGRLFDAKTTPHMFVINREGVLVYKGAIDDKPSTKKGDVKGAKNYVKAALDEAMAGQSVSQPSTESYGCSVKYKK